VRALFREWAPFRIRFCPGGPLNLYDYDKFQRYLFELESALSLIGIRDCQDLQADTQLSAAIYALLRATSLFRATLSLLEAGFMDAGDVMRRAYMEAWMLGYEFRLESSARHSKEWHREKHKHGIPEISRVRSYEEEHGIKTSTYGAAYGGLSEVSHPTKSAAENSIVTVSAIHGDKIGRIEHARETVTQGDAPAMMYLLIWTVFSEWPGMISLGIKPEDIPQSTAFYAEYDRQNPGAITE
jgi:hypothetical protein